jgi:hypothetical protein
LKLINQFKELQSIKEKLASHVAAQHKFTDQSKSLCAPGTRVDIQADINQWLSLGSSTKERIFWITGIAGSGKSTLSATIVENLRENRTPVAAQFFISRNILETVDPSKIIPTIAMQLAEFSPAAAGIIHDVLQRGFPPREKQVKELLLAPIRELSKFRNAVIILIDALDELQNAGRSVLEILSEIAPKNCDLPDNVRLLVTSRPEHWADISKSKNLEVAVFKQYALDTKSSVDEVHSFIVARMQEIANKEGWSGWPDGTQLWKLSEKANGLFHYAATALHWIEKQVEDIGTPYREKVFDEFAQSGIGQLEDLYKLILASFDDPAQNPDTRKKQQSGFRHVVGTILMLQEPLTIRQIIALVGDISVNDFDTTKFLQRFRSVLIPGMTPSLEEATPQMHKSFRDYIMDGHAPAELRIITSHAHFVTGRSCLEVIVKAGSQWDKEVTYSVKHWYQHLEKAVEEGFSWVDERVWKLCGMMVEEAVVNVWKAYSWDVFLSVAAVGWMLLKVRAEYGRGGQVTNDLPARN